MPGMSTPTALFAPWRMDYIRSLGGHRAADDGCFLCQAAAADTDDLRRDRLVLWRTDLTVVLLNRYPYANGHLLVAPRRHAADLEELTPAELADVGGQTVEAVRLLKRAVSAQGFNVGLNLGRVAGAGVPGHLHQHVVPRWGGDVNFMHVIGEVGIVPETTARLWEELSRLRQGRPEQMGLHE
jgi:ATP adenylyltransferase